jgi:hypothetical protein
MMGLQCWWREKRIPRHPAMILDWSAGHGVEEFGVATMAALNSGGAGGKLVMRAPGGFLYRAGGTYNTRRLDSIP